MTELMNDTLEAKQKRDELGLLRSELHFLKECQVKYFWGTVTATGAILGFGPRLMSSAGSNTGSGNDNSVSIGWLVYCAPLLVILPCWMLFFDKATTITRIVGYVRVLEYMLRNKLQTRFQWYGWECSLKSFRDYEKNNEAAMKLPRRSLNWILDAKKAMGMLFRFDSRARYWCITWLTFFGLSLACLGLASSQIHSLFDFFIVCAFGVVTLFAALRSAHLLHLLTDGNYNYNYNTETWMKVLSDKDIKIHYEQWFVELVLPQSYVQAKLTQHR